jgi:hypothetical protein
MPRSDEMESTPLPQLYTASTSIAPRRGNEMKRVKQTKLNNLNLDKRIISSNI